MGGNLSKGEMEGGNVGGLLWEGKQEWGKWEVTWEGKAKMGGFENKLRGHLGK